MWNSLERTQNRRNFFFLFFYLLSVLLLHKICVWGRCEKFLDFWLKSNSSLEVIWSKFLKIREELKFSYKVIENWRKKGKFASKNA